MTTHPHRALAAAAAAAAVLALAGCGGGSDDKENASSSSSSSATSSAASPATTAAASPDPGSSDTGSIADVVSRTMKDGTSAHITVDLAGRGSGEGDLAFDGDATAAQLTLEIGGQKSELRVVDGTVYIAVPGQNGRFMKLDTDQLGSMVGLDSSHLGLDPSQALEQLEKSGGTAKDVGDGHWQVIGKDGRPAADLYVGDDGYLQKVVIDAPGAGAITMTYSDWGEKVSVKAPPASDIIEVPGM